MKHTFDIKDCACKATTVYLDRAEVSRQISITLKEGENEVIFNNLSANIDEDSVRVEGKGPATISEVSFQSKLLTPQEDEEKKSSEDELQKQLKQLVEKEKVLGLKTARLQKQRTVLDGFADSVKTPSPKTKDNEKTLLTSDVLKGMGEFFDMFDDKSAKLDEAIHETQKQATEINQEIRALQQRSTQHRYNNRQKTDRHLSVLLEAQEAGDVQLVVSYLVSNARWSPKYDIRVFSEEKQIKIMYYGVIRQGTGEDWNDVKVSLSSAMPSVAGTVPPLGTQKLRLKRQEVYTEQNRMNAPMMMRAQSMAMESAMVFSAPPPPPAAPMTAMALPRASVREGISSAVFEIQRTSTIPSDNTEHKVTVAVIDLQPQFHYECIPKKSTFAYLKAKVTNSSQYAMLAGPTNIFLDNNFIAKGSLKAVSPGEEFECSCGIDPAIRISYKPVEKHRNKTGWMSKSNVTTFKQVIEVKNTHQTPAQIRLTEHYPQSTEGAIKVHLVDPASAAQKHENKGETDPGVFINKHHNIEWNFELAAGVSRDLVLRYTIELATSEELDFFEEFSPDD